MRLVLNSGARSPRSRAFSAAVALLAILVAGCGSGAGRDDQAAAADRPVIVATTSIWADVVGQVACDGAATIETLVPAGADPHSFEPSLADRAQMERATLIVANGLRLEEGLDDALEAVEAGGTEVFRMAEQVETIAYAADTGSPGEGEDGDDPHVWFDPVRVSNALPDLAARVVATTGLPASSIDACLASYRDDLAEVDAAIEEMLADVSPADRKLVTNHDALGYFADRYGFEVVGAVIPASSGLAQTSPAALEELASKIEQTGVSAVFVEEQGSRDDAEALARRVEGLAVVPLFTGSLGEPGSGADTYLSFLSTNARRVADALGG